MRERERESEREREGERERERERERENQRDRERKREGGRERGEKDGGKAASLNISILASWKDTRNGMILDPLRQGFEFVKRFCIKIGRFWLP